MRLSAATVTDPALRDELVMAHVDLVKSMAGRLRRRLPSHVELAELVSVGVIGLIDAATRYQPALGVPFDAFARRRIQGAMLDALRSLDRVSRSVRSLQREAEETTARLRQTLGREPESEEIAAGLGISMEEYTRLLDELQSVEIGVVRETQDGEHIDLLELVVDPEPGQHARLERRELRALLSAALTRLPDRERQILALSYGEEFTLAEIGRVFGIGESRVSQLRTQAIMRLRSLLKPALAGREGR